VASKATALTHIGPSGAPQSPTTATEHPGRVAPQAQVEGAQEGVRRPWWRRVFGG
jgi:hypothetical protein